MPLWFLLPCTPPLRYWNILKHSLKKLSNGCLLTRHTKSSLSNSTPVWHVKTEDTLPFLRIELLPISLKSSQSNAECIFNIVHRECCLAIRWMGFVTTKKMFMSQHPHCIWWWGQILSQTECRSAWVNQGANNWPKWTSKLKIGYIYAFSSNVGESSF